MAMTVTWLGKVRHTVSWPLFQATALRTLATGGRSPYPLQQEPVQLKERDGFPISVSARNQFPLCSDIHREDVYRFFKDCNITRDDIIVQYTQFFRPLSWWIRFHTDRDRKRAVKYAYADDRWGGKRVVVEEKSMTEWHQGTFNHLIGKSQGSAVLITRLAFDTTTADISSFFRNFHLQGNGVTIIQDPMQPNFNPQNQYRRAIVRLITQQEAQRAARALHRKSLRNNMVAIRVLQ